MPGTDFPVRTISVTDCDASERSYPLGSGFPWREDPEPQIGVSLLDPPLEKPVDPAGPSIAALLVKRLPRFKGHHIPGYVLNVLRLPDGGHALYVAWKSDEDRHSGGSGGEAYYWWKEHRGLIEITEKEAAEAALVFKETINKAVTERDAKEAWDAKKSSMTFILQKRGLDEANIGKEKSRVIREALLDRESVQKKRAAVLGRSGCSDEDVEKFLKELPYTSGMVQ